MQGYVQFLGEREDINRILQMADFFIFPSKREGLSNSLLEAMSSQLPIIASMIGGNVDLIENKKEGMLFDYGDKKQLLSCINFLLGNPSFARKIGYNARKKVIKGYSFRIVADKYSNLYNKIAHKLS